MKTLQKRVQILYRFRCESCRSKFEMTEEEKIENDWKFTNYHYSYKENGYVFGPVDHEKQIKSNPHDYFECPVCKCVSSVQRGEMHVYSVMDDGTEIQDY